MKKIITTLLLSTLYIFAGKLHTYSFISDDNCTLSYNLETESKRIYPYGNTFEPMLGYSIIKEHSRSGFETHVLSYMEACHSIHLTINLALQQSIEQILDDRKLSLQADEILVGVMDSKTGELRALASSNRYAPLQKVDANLTKIIQKFSTFSYEPGSVMMPLVIASALERGYIEKETLINVKGKLVYDNGKSVKDAIANDLLTAEGILLNMSNVGIGKIAYRFSGYEFKESLERFGLYQYTKMITYYGNKGYIPPLELLTQSMYRGNASYGYGINATFLQMLRAYSVFSNAGTLVEPRQIKALCRFAECFTVPVESVPDALNPDVARAVHSMLVSNVKKGLAKKANVPAVVTGGMGSTAYRIKNGKYVHEYNSSFYGFAEDAKGNSYTIGVLVIKPKDPKQFYASRSAVPVFADVVKAMKAEGFLK